VTVSPTNNQSIPAEKMLEVALGMVCFYVAINGTTKFRGSTIQAKI
jgi:hypothetical protein